MSTERTKRYDDRAARHKSSARSSDYVRPISRGRSYFGSDNSCLSSYKSSSRPFNFIFSKVYLNVLDDRPSRTSGYSNRTHFKYKSPDRSSRQSKSPKRPLYSFPKYDQGKRSPRVDAAVKTEDASFSDTSGGKNYENFIDTKRRFGSSALTNSSFNNSGFVAGQDERDFFFRASSKFFDDIPPPPPPESFSSFFEPNENQSETMVVDESSNRGSFNNTVERLEPMTDLVHKKEGVLPMASGPSDGKKNSGSFKNTRECIEPVVDLVRKEEEVSPVATVPSTGKKRKSLFIPPHWSNSASVIEEVIDDVLDDYNPHKHSKKKMRSAIEGVLIKRKVPLRSLRNHAREISAPTFYAHLNKAYSKVASKLGSSPQISDDAGEVKQSEKTNSTAKRVRSPVEMSRSANVVPKKQYQTNVGTFQRVSSSNVPEVSFKPPAKSVKSATAGKLKDRDNTFCADETKVAATQVIKKKHIDYLQGRKGGTPLVLPDHWKNHKKVLREAASEAMSINLTKNGDDDDVLLAILEVLLNVNTTGNAHKSIRNKVASSAFYKCVECAKEFAVSKLGLVPKEAVLSSSEIPHALVKEPTQATKSDKHRKMEKNIAAGPPVLPEVFVDCVVTADQRHFTLNKMFLAIHSGFFARIFEDNLRIKDMQEVKLSNVDAEQFSELLSVLYAPYQMISVLNIYFLLELGRQFEIPSVTQACVHFLSTSDEIGDAKKLLLSEQYNLTDLKDDIMERCGSKSLVQQLVKQPEFKLLSLSAQNRLYSSCFIE